MEIPNKPNKNDTGGVRRQRLQCTVTHLGGFHRSFTVLSLFTCFLPLALFVCVRGGFTPHRKLSPDRTANTGCRTLLSGLPNLPGLHPC